MPPRLGIDKDYLLSSFMLMSDGNKCGRVVEIFLKTKITVC